MERTECLKCPLLRANKPDNSTKRARRAKALSPRNPKNEHEMKNKKQYIRECVLAFYKFINIIIFII